MISFWSFSNESEVWRSVCSKKNWTSDFSSRNKNLRRRLFLFQMTDLIEIRDIDYVSVSLATF